MHKHHYAPNRVPLSVLRARIAQEDGRSLSSVMPQRQRRRRTVGALTLSWLTSYAAVALVAGYGIYTAALLAGTP